MSHVYCPHCNRVLDTEQAKPIARELDAAGTGGRAVVGWRCYKVFRWPDGVYVLEGRHGKSWLEPVLRARCTNARVYGFRARTLPASGIAAGYSIEPPVGSLEREYLVAREHILENSYCMCGIYAFYADCLAPKPDEVVVQVLGWGAVGLHELGFRSEYARAVAGWVRPNTALHGYWLEEGSYTTRGEGGRHRVVQRVPLKPVCTFEPVTVDMLRLAWPTVAWQEGEPPNGSDR